MKSFFPDPRGINRHLLITGFLLLLAIMLISCSGAELQQPQGATTIEVTPLPVPTVAVADFLPCNSEMVALFQRDEIDVELDYISGPFAELGKDPALLLDEDYVNQTFTKVDAAYEWALERAKQEGPACLSDYRNLILELLGLAQYHWALIQAGYPQKANEEVAPLISQKMQQLKNDILPALFTEAGMD